MTVFAVMTVFQGNGSVWDGMRMFGVGCCEN